MSKHVVIIGNGIAGVTAARFIRKWSDHRITIISGESDHFYSRTALMYIYMGHMRYEDTKPYEDFFWEKNRIDLIRDWVVELDASARQLKLQGGEKVSFDILILATGSKSRFFGWPGQDLEGVQGLYSLQDLEKMEANTRKVERAVVLGGGLIGIEMAEMLHARHIPVTMLVREQSFFNHVLPPEESALINAEIRDHHIDLRLGTEMKAVLGDDAGRVRGVVTSNEEELACQYVGITTGVTPNIDVVEASSVETGRGILVDAFLETNVPGIFAIGDCAEFREDGIGYRRIDQLWYTGRHTGRAVAQNICGARIPYQKPLFFNSAKFFTIEYQTYGEVPAQTPEGIATLCWHDEATKRLVRINYETDTNTVTGFNALGLRLSHAVCEKWLLEKRSVDYVLSHFEEANFDPEFYTTYHAQLRAQHAR